MLTVVSPAIRRNGQLPTRSGRAPVAEPAPHNHSFHLLLGHPINLVICCLAQHKDTRQGVAQLGWVAFAPVDQLVDKLGLDKGMPPFPTVRCPVARVLALRLSSSLFRLRSWHLPCFCLPINQDRSTSRSSSGSTPRRSPSSSGSCSSGSTRRPNAGQGFLWGEAIT